MKVFKNKNIYVLTFHIALLFNHERGRERERRAIDHERVGMNCETQNSTSDKALMRKRYRWHKRDLRSSLSSLPQFKEKPYTTCIISISEPFSFISQTSIKHIDTPGILGYP